MLAAASLAGVRGLTFQDVYEAEDPNFLLFSSKVIEKVIETREHAAREARRRQ